MPVLLASLLTGILAQEPSAAPPGGYLTIAEARERQREPLDGEDEIMIGSVLFSLGALRVGAAALTIWMAHDPNRCPADEPETCSGLEVYGWVGVGEGGLMLTTGAVYLAIGATRRSKYRRWQRGESVADRLQVAPWVMTPPGRGLRAPNGGGLQLQLRF